MSLQLILGASGSGKSYRLYEEVIQSSVNNPSQNYIVIVPEQFTMGTQEKIVKMHPNKGTLNIDIVSFQRLAHKVFEELGVKDREILDDTGKSLIVRKILEKNKDSLTVLKKNIDKPGFVEEIKSEISEMLQYGVSVEQLKNISEEIDTQPLLKHKLLDFLCIYENFKNYIQDKYIASEEILQVLCNVAKSSKILENSVITLDGFTGFTPIQYRLLGILMECCEKITVTVTIDSKERFNVLDGVTNLFHLSKETISKLYKIAEETGTTILENIVMEDEVPVRLAQSQGLTFLEKNIFRNTGATLKGNNDIQVFEGAMPKDEVVFVVGEIKRLVMEKGYHYRDFAIVSADMDSYGDLAVNILGQNGIPSFLDYKKNVMGNVAVTFIRGALNTIEEDFSYDSVFGFLKTGLSDIGANDADILENYCLALGIRGYNRYNSLWIRKSREVDKLKISVEYLNSIREKVVDIFTDFRNEIKESVTVLDYCTALYNFMVKMKLEQKLKIYSERFGAEGSLSLKGEYEQVYGKIVKLLDKFVVLMGEEEVSFREFFDILDAGLLELKVGLIPQASDAVIIGDIERTRLENVKVLFFVGVNDGIIPKRASGGGIISEFDKQVLKEHNVELSMTERDKVFVQRFYLYLSITKPTDRLYLSYSKICSDGTSRRMSYFLVTVRKLFPDIIIRDAQSEDKVFRLVEIPVRNMNWEFEKQSLDSEVAKKLYGEEYLTSISAIEKYSSCAFAHFVTYGLRLEERQLYDIQASDIGTLFHDTLERFSQKMLEKGYTFTEIGVDERKALVRECVEEIITDYGNTILYSTKRYEYLVQRVITMADRTVWAIGKQLQAGKYSPQFFEKKFVLDEKIMGRIDRIDTYEVNDRVYVKVVDYKTGNSDFDLLNTFYGLRIQLIIYMNAAMKIEKNKYPDKEIVPGAMFFYNINDPFVEDTEKTDEAILKKLCPNGVVNNFNEAVWALDMEAESKSVVAPVTFNKDRTARDNVNTYSRQGIEAIMKYVNMYTEESMGEILDGRIEVKPYSFNGSTGCDYCEYNSLCQFDGKVKNCKFNYLKNMKKEDVMKIIFEKTGDESDGTGMDQ